jgi:hypothetical protein
LPVGASVNVTGAFNLPDGFNSLQSTKLASVSASMVLRSQVELAQWFSSPVANLTGDLHLLSIHNIVCLLARNLAE